jgi:hypothetical protein
MKVMKHMMLPCSADGSLIYSGASVLGKSAHLTNSAFPHFGHSSTPSDPVGEQPIAASTGIPDTVWDSRKGDLQSGTEGVRQ